MGELINLGVKQDGKRIVVSSRIVADNFEKRHDNVLRDIEATINSLLKTEEINTGAYFIPTTYRDSLNREYPEYLLTRDGFTLLTMSWTGEKAMRFKVAYISEFNRMENALKAQQAYQIPRTYPEALRLAADLAEANERLKPKAEMHDLFLTGQNSQSMGVVAKTLGIGRNTLFKILREEKILMRNNVPYQKYIDRGYFEVIERPIPMGDATINKPKTLVTAKGVDYIGKLLKRKEFVA